MLLNISISPFFNVRQLDAGFVGFSDKGLLAHWNQLLSVVGVADILPIYNR